MRGQEASVPPALGDTWTVPVRDSNGALYVNIRGVCPKCNRTKLCYIQDMASESNSAFLILTEMHLTADTDTEVSVPGYQLFRADRAVRSHGGAMVYVRTDLSSQLVASHSNSYCEIVAVKVKTLDTLLLCVYRPPDCTFDKFREAINVCQESINKTMKEDTKVRNTLQLGDFNFPFISWPSKSIYSQVRENKSSEKRQAELLLEFADENFLENFIKTPTRGNNVLDLVFSNNHALINHHKTIVNNRLSDHNLLNLSLNFSYNQPVKAAQVKNPYSSKIYEYDTNNADEEDWARLEHYLQQIDDKQLENLDAEEQM